MATGEVGHVAAQRVERGGLDVETAVRGDRSRGELRGGAPGALEGQSVGGADRGAAARLDGGGEGGIGALGRIGRRADHVDACRQRDGDHGREESTAPRGLHASTHSAAVLLVGTGLRAGWKARAALVPAAAQGRPYGFGGGA